MCERELETEENCNILTPTLLAISVSFPFSSAAQQGAWGPASLGAGFLYSILFLTGLVSKLSTGAWGLPLLGAGFLYRILSPTAWISWALYYIIVHVHHLLMGVTSCTHSTHTRSRLYSAIPRPDAPVIYTGAFPILTARPGRRSIYNNHPPLIFQNFTWEIFLHVHLHHPHTFYKLILQDNDSWKKHKKKSLEPQQNIILVRRRPSFYVTLARLIII